jgi:antirestriction protein ArdC
VTLYDEITDKIIAELKAGRVPWVQPVGHRSGEGAAGDAGERRDQPAI